ncbi:DUF4157 domain-containing protein [Micromonospora sp. KC207]|uniref:eCIS core domain-containing protein n=1 Tax=Micromonospora sp. KC207 TaxID=2530377 RepID=UPI00104296B3|nr:DUF4157 domain-containing protein [Micromonospora sp. KC207]
MSGSTGRVPGRTGSLVGDQKVLAGQPLNGDRLTEAAQPASRRWKGQHVRGRARLHLRLAGPISLGGYSLSPWGYEPGSTAGRRILAHELTHVVQRRRGRGWDNRGRGSDQRPPRPERTALADRSINAILDNTRTLVKKAYGCSPCDSPRELGRSPTPPTRGGKKLCILLSRNR